MQVRLVMSIRLIHSLKSPVHSNGRRARRMEHYDPSGEIATTRFAQCNASEFDPHVVVVDKSPQAVSSSASVSTVGRKARDCPRREEYERKRQERHDTERTTRKGGTLGASNMDTRREDRRLHAMWKDVRMATKKTSL